MTADEREAAAQRTRAIVNADQDRCMADTHAAIDTTTPATPLATAIRAAHDTQTATIEACP